MLRKELGWTGLDVLGHSHLDEVRLVARPKGVSRYTLVACFAGRDGLTNRVR
jgi:hypothetical protein